jgi:hypothetical protein
MVDFYWPKLVEEYQTLFMAFSTVNRLFPDPATVKAKTVPTPAPGEAPTTQPEGEQTPPPPLRPKTAEEQFYQKQKEQYYLQLIQPTPFYPPLK